MRAGVVGGPEARQMGVGQGGAGGAASSLFVAGQLGPRRRALWSGLKNNVTVSKAHGLLDAKIGADHSLAPGKIMATGCKSRAGNVVRTKRGKVAGRMWILKKVSFVFTITRAQNATGGPEFRQRVFSRADDGGNDDGGNQRPEQLPPAAETSSLLFQFIACRSGDES